MTRNWNIVKARLADPFDPEWERVEQQVLAMIAEQDARGGHKYPPFRLPDAHPFTPSSPAVTRDAQGPAVRSGPVSFTPTPYNDRSYTEPYAVVRGKHGGQHTKISAAKIQEVRQSCVVDGKLDKKLWQKKIGKMHHKDNADRRAASDLPPVERQPTAPVEEEQPRKRRKIVDSGAHQDVDRAEGTNDDDQGLGRDGRPTDSTSVRLLGTTDANGAGKSPNGRFFRAEL